MNPVQEPVVVRTAAGTLYAAADVPAPQLAQLSRAPADLLWQGLDYPVKISRESLIVRVELPLAGGAVRVACKRFRPRSWWKAACGLFRSDRALRAWRLSGELLERQIATPRPLFAWVPSRWSWRHRESYLATEWIDGAENLHLYGWRLAGRPITERLRHASRCAESLGRLIGRVHAAGMTHRDLKAANLLAVERDSGVETCLIDLDGLRVGRHPSAGLRAANLARLAAGLEAHPWVTPAICLRFLRCYIGQLPPGSVAWKPLWRAVARRCERIIRRKKRRGQEVL